VLHAGYVGRPMPVDLEMSTPFACRTSGGQSRQVARLLEPTVAAPAADIGRPDGLGITPDMQRGCELAASAAAYRSAKYVHFACCMLDQDVPASCLRPSLEL